MIKIKEGADVYGLQYIMWRAIYSIEKLFHFAKLDLVITSGVDGHHSSGSLHYVGLAVDIRTRELNDAYKMFEQIKEILPDAYDVVYHKTHIHIEYQPKNQAERIALF